MWPASSSDLAAILTHRDDPGPEVKVSQNFSCRGLWFTPELVSKTCLIHLEQC
jgi:hypothetical protein